MLLSCNYLYQWDFLNFLFDFLFNLGAISNAYLVSIFFLFFPIFIVVIYRFYSTLIGIVILPSISGLSESVRHLSRPLWLLKSHWKVKCNSNRSTFICYFSFPLNHLIVFLSTVHSIFWFYVPSGLFFLGQLIWCSVSYLYLGKHSLFHVRKFFFCDFV